MRSSRFDGRSRPLLLLLVAGLHVGPGGAMAAELRASGPQQLKEAIEAARPGDSIVMADGPWADADIVFRGEGRADRPITLRAETPGRVVLGGAARLRIAGRYLVVDGLVFANPDATTSHVVEFRRSNADVAEHCRLTRCAIIRDVPTRARANSRWVSLYGAENRVDHCSFRGKDNLGPTLVVWVADRPNGHRIEHNHFGHRPPLGMNGGETIRVGTSDVSMHDSRTVVEFNYFEGCDGEAEIISNKSCENVYRSNTFVGCAGALTLRHGNRCTVEGNAFFGEGKRGSGGVRIVGEGHRVVNNYFEGLSGSDARAALSIMNGLPDSPLAGYFRVKDALVAFNTFVDNEHTIVIGVGNREVATLPPLGCTFANNVLVGRRAPLVEPRGDSSGLTWRGNLTFGADPGIAPPDGLAVADPRLERGDGGLLRPSSTSPAIGEAVGDDLLVGDDIDGQPREGKADVGCDQRSDRPVRRRPPGPGDVGPGWMRERRAGANP